MYPKLLIPRVDQMY